MHRKRGGYKWDCSLNGMKRRKRLILSNMELFYDVKHSTAEEDRYITIGVVEEILTVVYTERTTALRIISARAATKKERMVYYGN